MVNSEKIGQIAQGRELYQNLLLYSTGKVLILGLNRQCLKSPW
jgi:hypothetical protein